MHILKPRPHGVIDYAAIVLLAAAPSLFGFDGTPETLCYAIAGIYLVMSLFTAYPLGLVKAIPFTAHGGVELVLAPLLAALPWLAGFADVPMARNFFLVMAVALLGVWLVTDYKAAAQDPASHRPHQRSHA
jgi:hypothetical protein